MNLDALFASIGAAGWGAADYGALLPHMDQGAREKAEALCPHPATVLVAAFPYYAGDRPGNLSLYARGLDYHLALLQRLEEAAARLRQEDPAGRFVPGADNSPLPEREAAWRAGLGLQGENGLVILPPYGSWVFLGTILTDRTVSNGERAPSSPCLRCGKCVSACPGGALSPGGFRVDRCLSHLTQKKGELPPEEEKLVRAHPLIWGCDRCQTVCPYNAHPLPSPLPEFREELVDSLTSADLAGLTNRQFREQYGRRAFAWRGPAPLRRNLDLRGEKSEKSIDKLF
ncbi:epoxyqueuosine reductase [Pseudoflavonifractor phocaeensis]|uniref:epoxyqueuosine reductase n=1 Tax=Pseudoflavonifractor phocaeensis TaxID=1870988 RepID=UPI00195857E7|nr:QueG-associated DUF1730 domain-containing protein [Pseudoflavonifractor phocaeensis]MBM6937799.1 epoxyqueuosine reductase [Pseudoflavonifractor phocaeensis]